MGTITRPRITPHQREILNTVCRMAAHVRDGWVLASVSGAPTALEHLHRKGYLDRSETAGPRGGRILSYRPVDYRSDPDHERWGPSCPARVGLACRFHEPKSEPSGSYGDRYLSRDTWPR